MGARTSESEIPSRKGRERHAALLGALGALLAERPLAEIEIDHIAKRAGIGRSGFYFYFPTKAAAVAALLEQTFAQMVGVASDWYERDDLPHHDRVHGGLTATIEFWREHATLLAAITDAAATGGEAHELWDTVQAELRERAAERIRTDQTAGLVDEDVDARSMALVLVGMTVQAMHADVRVVIASGSGLPGIEEALIRAWDRTLYDVSSI